MMIPRAISDMQLTAVRTLTSILAAPLLNGSVNGSTASLNWTAPIPTGQSLIAGYRLYKGASATTINTLVGTFAGLTTTDTVSGTQFYQVEAFDQYQAGNRSLVLSLTVQAGALAHGSSVAINGSGFGSVSPLFWFGGGAGGEIETTTPGLTPDFGNNVNGGGTSHILGTMNWRRYTINSGDAIVLTDPVRGRVVGRNNTGEGECSQEFTFASPINYGETWMMLHWARYAVTQTQPSAQVKFTRLMCGTSNEADQQPTTPVVYDHYNVDNGGYMIDSSPGYADGAANKNTWYVSGQAGAMVLGGVWQRVEKKIIAPSAPGAANAQYLTRSIHGSVPAYVSGVSAQGNPLSGFVGYPDTQKFIAFMYQCWYGNGFSNMNFAIDDHCILKGTRRAELRNSLTPSGAILRNFCAHTSWTDTQVVVNLNTDGFPSGSHFLCVVDDDTVLGYRPITI